MGYFLILLVISFVTNFIQKKIKSRKEKKKIIWVLRVLRLASYTSALIIATVLVSEYIRQKITKVQDEIYTIHNANPNECYYAQINPALFPKKIAAEGTILPESGEVSGSGGTSGNGGTSGSDSTSGSGGASGGDGTSGNGGTSGSDGTSGNGGTSGSGSTSGNDGTPLRRTETIISYDFSILMIFGEHQFGEYITPKDLLDMRSMYNEYWEKEMYRDMLEQDNKTDADSVNYAQNAEENIESLEQSAIAAENDAESDNIETIDGYESLLSHIRESVLKFSCVIGSNNTKDSSIRTEDIKFHMGKMLYKPAADLADITNSEKYYSLCCAYAVLKDAFDYSSLDSAYAVDVAYSYLLVCNDIVNAMEPGQSKEMINRVKLAYYQLLERVNETSNNPKYQSYREEAKQIMNRLEDNN